MEIRESVSDQTDPKLPKPCKGWLPLAGTSAPRTVSLVLPAMPHGVPSQPGAKDTRGALTGALGAAPRRGRQLRAAGTARTGHRRRRRPPPRGPKAEPLPSTAPAAGREPVPAGRRVRRSPGDAAEHHGTGHGAAAGQEPPPHGGGGSRRGVPPAAGAAAEAERRGPVPVPAPPAPRRRRRRPARAAGAGRRPAPHAASRVTPEVARAAGRGASTSGHTWASP